jgi:hypothetical protein
MGTVTRADTRSVPAIAARLDLTMITFSLIVERK